MEIHVQVSNQRRFVVPASASVAFQFFTPKGEEFWVDDWAPRYLHPPAGETAAGMVFTTGEGAEFTVWHLVEFDEGARRSRYVRTTPSSRTGVVTVQATALDLASTEILVRYDMVALSAGSASSLDAYRDPAFVAMIEGWSQKIRARLPELLQAFGHPSPVVPSPA